MRRFLLTLMLLLTTLPLAASAADGIATGEAFKLPFTVDGTEVPNRAEFSVVDGKAILTVYYLKGDQIAKMVYGVARSDEPAPQPGPQPDPSPEPLVAPWGIIIEESADRTPAQAQFMASSEVRALFGKGRFRIVDPVNDEGKVIMPTDSMGPYVEKALPMRKDWPVMFIVSQDGKFRYTGKMPETYDAAEKLVGKKAEGVSSECISGTCPK